MSNYQEEQALLARVASQLGEHFDTVQIFASKHDPAEADGTVTLNYGVGNWYARYGQVIEWTIKHDEDARKSMYDDES